MVYNTLLVEIKATANPFSTPHTVLPHVERSQSKPRSSLFSRPTTYETLITAELDIFSITAHFPLGLAKESMPQHSRDALASMHSSLA